MKNPEISCYNDDCITCLLEREIDPMVIISFAERSKLEPMEHQQHSYSIKTIAATLNRSGYIR